MIALSPLPSATPTPVSAGGPSIRKSSSAVAASRRRARRRVSASISSGIASVCSKRPRSKPELDEAGSIGTLPTTGTLSEVASNVNSEGHLSASFLMIGEDLVTESQLVSTVDHPGSGGGRISSKRSTVSTVANVFIDSPLHRPKNAKHVLYLLQNGHDPNQRDSTHDQSFPIHSIVRSHLKDRSKCLETLLVHGNIDVNSRDAHRMTALHFAAMSGDLRCIKLLLSFNADINAISDFDQTPMNLAIAHYQETAIQLFGLLGGISAAFVMRAEPLPLPPVTQFRSHVIRMSSDSSDNDIERVTRYEVPVESIRPFDPRLQLEARIQSSFSVNEHEAVSLILQQQEANLLHQHYHQLMHSLTYRSHNGSRILCLDGMGTRGVILLEVLEQLVEVTGQPVTDMFDVICGSSTGALVALGLVYGKRSLSQLRQSLYKLKENVFSGSQSATVDTTDELEFILTEMIGDDRHLRLSDVREPKVIVFAVNKETTDLKLRAFNNCFDDGYSQESVLRVAHYSISPPTCPHNSTNYVDASLLANNPLDYALTRLQQHYYLRHEQCPVSLVVSIGTGVYTHDKMGMFPRISSSRVKSRAVYQRIQNFLVLMRNSLIQSEEVSGNCCYRCRQLGIPYYRFSPQLREKVSIYETDIRKLLNSVLRTRIELQNVRSGFDDFKDYIYKLSKSYTASGSGLCEVVGPSDVLSPSELVPRPISSDTTSSGEELQKLHFFRRYRLSPPPPS